MKLLVFSDVHADNEVIENLIKKAKKSDVDVLISAGDLAHFGVGLDEAFKKLNIGIPLLIVPGNHEASSQIANAAKQFKFIRNIHAKTVFLGSVLFFGCGGSSFTPFGTPNELSEKDFKELLVKFNAEQKKNATKFVLVLHDPPYNTKMDLLDSTHNGSKAVRAFVDKYEPDYCICGHFHENKGKQDKLGKTILLNPGPTGKIIEI